MHVPSHASQRVGCRCCHMCGKTLWPGTCGQTSIVSLYSKDGFCLVAAACGVSRVCMILLVACNGSTCAVGTWDSQHTPPTAPLENCTCASLHTTLPCYGCATVDAGIPGMQKSEQTLLAIPPSHTIPYHTMMGVLPSTQPYQACKKLYRIPQRRTHVEIKRANANMHGVKWW